MSLHGSDEPNRFGDALRGIAGCCTNTQTGQSLSRAALALATHAAVPAP